MTQSARVPRAIAASASASTDSDGTQKTARSTGSGSWSTEGNAFTPAIDGAFGFTGKTTPVKFESRMLRKSSPPIEPRRDEAPTTATDCGEKNGRSEAATAT